MIGKDIVDLADPERRLALAYAPQAGREGLAVLWALDERMGAIVAAAREPAIGAMRLLWWRDALIRLDDPDIRVPAEPLLAQIAAGCFVNDVTGADLSGIEEGWSTLLDDETPDEAAIRLHGAARGGILFDIAARLLGRPGDAARMAGEGWALADLGHRLRDRDARTFARGLSVERLSALPMRSLPRALGVLAVLARRDAAMPVDRQRRQGAPGRIARAVLHGVTGR